MQRTQLAIVVLMLAFFSKNATSAEPTGTEVFNSLAKLLLGGTWTTTFAKNGEQVAHTYSTVGNKFLRNDMKGGPMPGMAVVGVDPSTKLCSWWGYLSDGNIVKMTVTQEKDGVWLLQSNDNSSTRYKGRVTRVDDDTIKEEALELLVSGEKQPVGFFTWKRHNRVSAATMPAHVQEQIEKHIIGEWTYKGSWGDKRFSGEDRVRWADGKAAVITEGEEDLGGKKNKYVYVMGWDGESQKLVGHGFNDAGETYHFEWTQLSANTWTGNGYGIYRGEPWKSPAKYEFKDNWQRYEDTTDGNPWVAEFTRKHR